MTVGVLLLAAGSSRRFGADKRHARIGNGKTVLESTLQAIQQTGLPLLVCLPKGDTDTAGSLKSDGLDCYQCSSSSQGMGATLAEGISQVGGWNAVLIGLADMPYIEASTYRAVAEQIRPDAICVPTYRGQRGHPVGFGREFFLALAQLSGDEGAKNLLRKHRERVTWLELADAGILRDVDRPEDIR